MKYSDNIDYLISSILYLGTHTWYWARTPRGMASELSLDEARLLLVFDSFPSIFRKSSKPGDHDQHFYSLQARYAQREGGDTREPEKISYIAPLDTEKLNLLFDFVLKMTEHERTDARTRLTSWIAVAAAVVSAGAAILVGVLK
jgi:hypothetical protein